MRLMRNWRCDVDDKLKLLRRDFDPAAIEKKPKESKRQIEERKNNQSAGINCKVCGQFHHKNAVHLDYVGHAAVTGRLLEVDPNWNWEPVAFGSNGLPAIDADGGLWIRLTILGVSRLGYGSAEIVQNSPKSKGDIIKELIGDAIRNAAMRFGVALNLWHKGESVWSCADDDLTEAPSKPEQFFAYEVIQSGSLLDDYDVVVTSGPKVTDGQLRVIRARLASSSLDESIAADAMGVSDIADLPASECNKILDWIKNYQEAK